MRKAPFGFGRGATCLIAFIALFLPATALAQSAISGLVTDPSGGVLPGVTVEAASAALIEKVRSVSTDTQGRYTIVDLRPGVYTLTFSLGGFATLVREGIDLPSNFTATINAELRIGAVEESVTVAGQSPIVDVQSTQQTSVLKRELLDAVPTSRNYAPVVAMAMGVKVQAQNVGGGRTGTQQRLTVHGSISKDTTIAVDGMKMNSMTNDGDTQAQHNDAMTQEIVVQTGGVGADVSSGGVYVNLIPREGGNTLSGANYFGYSNRSMQANNVTPELRAQGVTLGDALDLYLDINPSLGGPVQAGKVWFFTSFRTQNNNNIVANSFYPDGRPGMLDQRNYNATGRLTWQAAERHKVTFYMDRAFHYIGHLLSSGTEVIATRRRTPPLFYTSAVKWTSPVSNRFLFEAGVGAHAVVYKEVPQDGVEKVRGTPEWYATASRMDLVLGTTKVAPGPSQYHHPIRYVMQTSGSYVTGSHAFKTGIQWNFGFDDEPRDINADLEQRYRTGIPDSVRVYNTPAGSSSRVNADIGLYAQDSWRIRRLTINPGVRLEYFNGSMEAVSLPPGRFVGARTFPRVPDLPEWFNVTPRLGVAYDVTGDAKTAIRASVNKYMRQYATGFTDRYSPAGLQNDIRNWRDANGDDIAQDIEIGASNNALFGAAPPRRPAADYKREYDMEYSIGVDRELTSGVAVRASWIKREAYNRAREDNLLIDVSDYVAFETPNPLTGEPITIYNLNPAKQGLVDILDTNATDRSKNRQSYTGFEVSATGRLPRGGLIFGGWSADRPITVACDGDDPNTFRFCDQSVLDIPFTHDFKLSGSYPIPFGVLVGATFQSYAVTGTSGSTAGSGKWLPVSWVVPPNVFPGGRRTQSVTVNLIAPGAVWPERWNQLDFSIKRLFTVGKYRIDAALEIFNATNNNTVMRDNRTYGPALGQPLEILQPRLLRISSQLRF